MQQVARTDRSQPAPFSMVYRLSSYAGIQLHPVQLSHIIVDTTENYMARAIVSIEMVLHLIYSYFYSKLRRVVINATADGGEGNGVEIIAARQRQALTIASGEQFWLAQVSAAPDRADRMVYTLDRQSVARSGSHIPYRAAANATTGLE